MYTELERDATTKDLIDRIRQLKQHSQPPATVEPCTPAKPTTPVESAPVTNPSTNAVTFPDGVYRRSMTADELIAAGASPPWSHDVAGVWTLTFDHGKVEYVVASAGGTSDDAGRYCVTDGRVSVDLFPRG